MILEKKCVKHLMALTVLMVHSLAVAQEEMKYSVEITGLSIQKSNNAASFSSQNETNLDLRLTVDQEIVRIDKEKTKLLSVTDDKGTQILKNGLRWRSKQSYFTSRLENAIGVSDSKVSDRTVSFPIQVTALPTTGAKAINIKADVVLLCYPKERLTPTQSGALKLRGAVGEVNFLTYYARFSERGSGSSNGGPMKRYIGLETNAIIEKITYMDGKGKTLETIEYPSAISTLKIEESLIPKIKTVNIEYIPPRVVKVPMEVTTTLGI